MSRRLTMSIPTINNTSTAADSRGNVRQGGTQPGASNGPGSGVNNGSLGKQSSSAQSQTDAVSISSQAADLQSLEASIRSLPDTDVSRIAELKDKISTGNYAVDGQRVADKMLAFERNL